MLESRDRLAAVAAALAAFRGLGADRELRATALLALGDCRSERLDYSVRETETMTDILLSGASLPSELLKSWFVNPWMRNRISAAGLARLFRFLGHWASDQEQRVGGPFDYFASVCTLRNPTVGAMLEVGDPWGLASNRIFGPRPHLPAATALEALADGLRLDASPSSLMSPMLPGAWLEELSAFRPPWQLGSVDSIKGPTRDQIERMKGSSLRAAVWRWHCPLFVSPWEQVEPPILSTPTQSLAFGLLGEPILLRPPSSSPLSRIERLFIISHPSGSAYAYLVDNEDSANEGLAPLVGD